jgi:hypothetical protein
MVVKMKIKYLKSKKRNQAAKKTQKKSKKAGKVMKSKKSMKSKKNVKSKKGMKTRKTMKNRIHLKHIPKRKLAHTLKKARKKIQKQLKKLYLKGGSKGGAVLEGMELPQHEGQTGASMNALGGAMIVGGQAAELNVVKPEVLY